jgi:hypothetical protein
LKIEEKKGKPAALASERKGELPRKSWEEIGHGTKKVI